MNVRLRNYVQVHVSGNVYTCNWRSICEVHSIKYSSTIFLMSFDVATVCSDLFDFPLLNCPEEQSNVHMRTLPDRGREASLSGPSEAQCPTAISHWEGGSHSTQTSPAQAPSADSLVWTDTAWTWRERGM